MNLNKVKKIAVKFPNFINANMVIGDAQRNVLKFKEARNINLELMTEQFAGDSGMQVGARNLPHIEGFNATMLNDIYFPAHYAMQFTFASGEEKKVMRIIDRYGGTIIPIREDLHQFGKEETNLNNTGTQYNYENVNETIQCPDGEQYNGNNRIRKN